MGEKQRYKHRMFPKQPNFGEFTNDEKSNSLFQQQKQILKSDVFSVILEEEKVCFFYEIALWVLEEAIYGRMFSQKHQLVGGS